MTDLTDLLECECMVTEHTLSEFEEFTPERIYLLGVKLVEEAKQLGFTSCYLKFRSNMEPYENFLSCPTVSVWGYRKKTKAELQEDVQRKETEALAKLYDISYYEASVLGNIKHKLPLGLA